MELNFSRKSRIRAMLILWVYVIIKFLAARRVMETFSINPWTFLCLDMVTVPTYILGWSHLLASLTGRLRRFRVMAAWCLLTLVSSAAPYLYAAWAGRRDFPAQAWILLFVIALFPLVSLGRKIHGAIRPCSRTWNPSQPPEGR
ncbi:MAG: hypothetical protein V1793_19175 [Pseudomonadota bacterium]